MSLQNHRIKVMLYGTIFNATLDLLREKSIRVTWRLQTVFNGATFAQL